MQLVYRVSILAAISASHAAAQGAGVSGPGTTLPAARPIAAAVSAFESTVLKDVQPAVRTWILNQGTAAHRAASDIAAIDQAVRAGIRTRFAGQQVGAVGSDALVSLVALEAARQLLSEIAALMAELRLARAEQVSLRDFLAAVQSAADSTSRRSGTDLCTVAICRNMLPALTSLASSEAKLRLARTIRPREARTFEELRAIAIELKAVSAGLDSTIDVHARRLASIIERNTREIQKLEDAVRKLEARIVALELKGLK